MEWPAIETTFGPSGSPARCSAYPAGPSQSMTDSISGSTTSRGMPSTRQNMSARSSAAPATIESPQEPMSTVVTPWRSDSVRPGATSSSAS